MRRVVSTALVAAATLTFAAALRMRVSETSPAVTIFGSDPSHLWNRLYATLLVRKDRHGNLQGVDSLDPLLWGTTKHLLEPKSHARALEVLDEFLQKHAEAQIDDPLRRALLQRDLWAVFDWSVEQSIGDPTYDNEKHQLQIRLAEALRRLALTSDEIKSLPDNYHQAVVAGAFPGAYNSTDSDQAFLPTDLFDPHGPWVGITPNPENNDGVAKMHQFSVSGRSNFLVFVRLPDGRKATMDYFQTLWNYPQPYAAGPRFASDEQAMVNPDLPSFPAGTEVALVRRMNLFDKTGNLEETNLTESVQIRVYHAITPTGERFFSRSIDETIKKSGQDFYEFELSRPLLFAQKNGGLRAVGRQERQFSTFQTKGVDPFEGASGRTDSDSEPPVELQHCVWCHSGGGVRSLNSRENLLRPNRMQMEPQNADYGPIYWSENSALAWKQDRYDWGLLNGYWKSTSPNVAH